MIVLATRLSAGAADGIVHPDSARVQCTFQTTGDTLRVQFANLSAAPIENLVFSHQSLSTATLVRAVLDGQTVGAVTSETEHGTVITDWYTNRWLISSFNQSLSLVIYTPPSAGSHFTWSAGHPYPIFGWADVMCATCCCIGTRGNVNSVGLVDATDLAAVVSYLTGGGYVLPCPEEANVNGQGIADATDLAALVSYLTGGGFVLATCP